MHRAHWSQPDILHILIFYLHVISFRHFTLGPTSWPTLSCKSRISKYCLILYIFIFIYRDVELLVFFLTFSCSIGYQGFADYCYRFYAVKKGTSEIKCIRVHGMFRFVFSPPADIRHSRDSGVKRRLNGCPTVFVGTVHVKLVPTWKCIDCKRLSRFPRCCCSDCMYCMYFPACLTGGANRPLLALFFCAVHKLVENNKPAFCFPSERVNPTLCT